MAIDAALSQVVALDERELTRPRSLDELAALRAPALLELYRAAEPPEVCDLHGALQGRMLAVRGAGRLGFALLRAFAAWRHFPWRGKSFSARSLAARGEGINRVFGDVARWFRFETFIGPSLADGGQALQLDYDNSDNPFFIRVIKDEVRRFAPGLYLGQAYVVLFGKPRLALYFALSAQPDAARPRT